MAAFMLQSLVLRGSVRLGGPGYLRLGRSMQASGQVPGIITSRQLLPGKRSDNPSPNGGAPNVVDATKGASPGAGRSRRHAGSPRCLGTARTIATRWWPLTGGSARAAAAKDQALFACFAASAVEVGSLAEILATSLMGRQERSR
jgi:hypothetical protein